MLAFAVITHPLLVPGVTVHINTTLQLPVLHICGRMSQELRQQIMILVTKLKLSLSTAYFPIIRSTNADLHSNACLT
jgi:hypothetical protein